MFSIIYGILLTIALLHDKMDKDEYAMFMFLGMLLIGLCVDITTILITLQVLHLI